MKSPETKVTSGGDVSTPVYLRQAESCVLPAAIPVRIVDHQNHAHRLLEQSPRMLPNSARLIQAQPLPEG